MLKPYSINNPNHKRLYKNDNPDEFIDVFSQKPGQEEDNMSEAHVRNGYSVPAQIRNETPSAFDIIQENLAMALPHLSTFGKDIIDSNYCIPIPSKSIFQIPERVFMKEGNKEIWLDDLANGVRSLADLAAAKVPLIGIKDAKVLDECVGREIPFQRALWLIKCIGYNHMAPPKTAVIPVEQKSQDLNQSFCKEWTKSASQYLMDQFISLQSDAIPSKKLQSQVKEEFYQMKLHKFNYLISLCKIQYDEGLFVKYEFVRQTVIIFQKALVLNQISAAVALVALFMNDIQKSRQLMKQVSFCCLTHMTKLKPSARISPTAAIAFCHVKTLLQNIFILMPNVFISHAIWKNVLPFKRDLFYFEHDHLRLPLALRDKITSTEHQIRIRSSRLFPTVKLKDTENSLHAVLISYYNYSTDCDNLKFHFSQIDIEVEMILRWAIAPEKLNPRRIYAASKVLSIFSSDREQLDKLFQRFIINNLTHQKKDAIAYLFGILEDFYLFHFERLFNYILAGGELDKTDKSANKLAIYLGSFFIRNSSSDYVFKRSIWLPVEAALLEEAKLKISAALPGMFQEDLEINIHLQEPSSSDSFFGRKIFNEHGLVTELSSSLSLFSKIRLSEWIRDSIFKFKVYAQTIGIDNWKTFSILGASVLNLRQFSFLAYILETFNDLHTLLEICAWLMGNTTDKGILQLILVVFQKNRHIYAIMDCSSLIYETVWKKFGAVKSFLLNDFALSMAQYFQTFFSTSPNELAGLIKSIPKPTNKKCPSDFEYLGNSGHDRASISKTVSRMNSDLLSGIDGGFKLLLAIFTHLSLKFDILNAESFDLEMSIYSYIIRRAQDCGNLLEGALRSFLLGPSVKPFLALNWFYRLLFKIICYQGLGVSVLLSELIIPYFNDFKSNHMVSFISISWINLLRRICGLTTDQLDNAQIILSLKACQSNFLGDGEGLKAILRFHSICQLYALQAGTPEDVVSVLKSFIADFYNCDLITEHISVGMQPQYLPSLILDGRDNITPLMARSILKSLLPTKPDFLNKPISAAFAKDGLEFLFQEWKYSIMDAEIWNAALILLTYLAKSFESDADIISPLLCAPTLFSIDFNSLSSWFPDIFRSSFLSHLGNFQEELEEIGSGVDSFKEIKYKKFFDSGVQNHYTKSFATLVLIIFGSVSSLAKDESKKPLKPLLEIFCSALIKSLTTMFNRNDFSDPESSHIIFRLYFIVFESIVRFIVELQENVDIIPIAQVLFELFSSEFLAHPQLNDLWERVFDVLLILTDDLPKSKVKEFTQWLLENQKRLLNTEPSPRRYLLMTIFPTSESTILDGFQSKAEGEEESQSLCPVTQSFFKPWEFIGYGIIGSSTDLNAWNSSLSISQLNDTTVSLSHFRAKRIHPQIPTFEELYERGWRPLPPLKDAYSDFSKNVFEMSEELRNEARAPQNNRRRNDNENGFSSIDEENETKRRRRNT